MFLADDHAGSPQGLFPGEVWDREDGEELRPKGFQVTLRQHFLDCAYQVRDLRLGGRLIIVHAGDAVEGAHHGTVQLLTQRIDEQERMHVENMSEFMKLTYWDKQTDQLIYLAGTEAHCGSGNSSTERIVRALLDKEKLDGREVRMKLVADIDGVLFDVAHKGFRLSSRDWLRTNAMRASLESRHSACAKAGQRLPRYVIRAHMHTFAHAAIEDKQGTVISEAFLLPAFKLPDDYALIEVQEAVGSIGVLPITIHDGRPEWHKALMTCDPIPLEVL
ncbi:MAG: hypothetical protein WC718_17805 [Phycisphaerales bacterium]